MLHTLVWAKKKVNTDWIQAVFTLYSLRTRLLASWTSLLLASRKLKHVQKSWLQQFAAVCSNVLRVPCISHAQVHTEYNWIRPHIRCIQFVFTAHHDPGVPRGRSRLTPRATRRSGDLKASPLSPLEVVYSICSGLAMVRIAALKVNTTEYNWIQLNTGTGGYNMIWG